MILIGEKINGAIPAVAAAIEARDEEAIRARAKAQDAAGADYIDVCASVAGEQEPAVLQWLIEQVQAVSELPICIDSPNSNSCVAAMKFCNKPGIINSVSMEGDKIDVVFPAIAETDWQCVALLCASGIPASAAERLHIDPLVEMLCTSMNGISLVTEVMREIKKQYPTIHIMNCTPKVRQYVILITIGVFFYAKRDSKQTIYA